MEVKASVRFLRMSTRKIRWVIDVVRGMPVQNALYQLRFMKKGAALPVRKLIESAVANAVHNNKLSADDLVIKAITADGGPMLKRFRARAFGRAAPIRKRSTHIFVTLAPALKSVSAPVVEKVEEKKPRATRRTTKEKKTAPSNV